MEKEGQRQCEFVVGQSANGDEVCVCVATDALRNSVFRRISVAARGRRAAGSARAERARTWAAAQERVGQPGFGDEVCVVVARPRIHIVPARPRAEVSAAR